jgi:acyl-CoA reductase-like NAD-dependent aldehyde dehydrogenase
VRRLRNYIGGRWVEGDGERILSRNPFDGSVIADAPLGDARTVNAAVDAARRAFEEGSWSGRRGADRAAALLALADALEAREREVGELIGREMGKPARIARGREVAGSVDRLRYAAGAARMIEGRVTGATIPEVWDLEVAEPVGVCALIIPWNDPVDLAIRKMGAALAVGCPVVVKPSELTPASTALLFEIADELGAFPPGVLNLVHGSGARTGEALVAHRDVDKISFTGSTQTGKHIMELAAQRLAKISLECGGKAPAIVFEDADLDRCADALTYGAFMYGGQSCTACARLIVHEAVHDELVDAIVQRSTRLPAGDPMDPNVFVGPMVSEEQYDKAVSYVRIGLDDGAKAVIGGEPEERDGLFLPPTVLVDVPRESRVTREEVFGPVLSVHRFEDEADAVNMANATPYGLGGSIWTADVSRALRTARRLDVADIWVNTYYIRNAETSFGGRHLSGLGRELGMAGLEEYVSWKRVCIDTRAAFHLKDWFEGEQGFRG